MSQVRVYDFPVQKTPELCVDQKKTGIDPPLNCTVHSFVHFQVGFLADFLRFAKLGCGCCFIVKLFPSLMKMYM